MAWDGGRGRGCGPEIPRPALSSIRGASQPRQTACQPRLPVDVGSRVRGLSTGAGAYHQLTLGLPGMFQDSERIPDSGPTRPNPHLLPRGAWQRNGLKQGCRWCKMARSPGSNCNGTGRTIHHLTQHRS